MPDRRHYGQGMSEPSQGDLAEVFADIARDLQAEHDTYLIDDLTTEDRWSGFGHRAAAEAVSARRP